MITEFGEGKGSFLWWGKILSLCRSLWCHSFSDLLARPSFFSLHLSLGQILSSFHLELPVNFFYPFTILIFSSPLPIHYFFSYSFPFLSPGTTFSIRGFESAYIYTRTFLKYKPSINQEGHFWAIKCQISGMSCSKAVLCSTLHWEFSCLLLTLSLSWWSIPTFLKRKKKIKGKVFWSMFFVLFLLSLIQGCFIAIVMLHLLCWAFSNHHF